MLTGSGSAYLKKYILSRRFHVDILSESERYNYTLTGSGSFDLGIFAKCYTLLGSGSADLKKNVTAEIRFFPLGDNSPKAGATS